MRTSLALLLVLAACDVDTFGSTSRADLVCLPNDFECPNDPPPAEVAVPGDVATVQEALDRVADGGTIRLAASAYVETLTIAGKQVQLIGSPAWPPARWRSNASTFTTAAAASPESSRRSRSEPPGSSAWSTAASWPGWPAPP